jgi:hypothetical protein
MGTVLTNKYAEEALDQVEITVNKNTIPFETKSPSVTSGIRIGTPNGRIKVKLYPGGVLGKERENFVNVQNNVVQATLSSVGGVAQFYKPIQVVDIPFAFRNHNVAWEVYNLS